MGRAANWCIAVLSLLVILSGAVRAAEADKTAAEKADEVFESLYGADVRRVKATRDPKDDMELAGRLLDAARQAESQGEFMALLCEKACGLAGAFPEGAATALAAMELLSAKVPEKAAACAERIVDVRQRQFDLSRGEERLKDGEALIDALLAACDAKAGAGVYGDATALCRRAVLVATAVRSQKRAEIDSRIKAMADAAKVAREVEELKGQLAKDPQNAATRERLVRLCLVDRDNPAEAAQYVEGVADESLCKYVRAAAKGVETAPELACMELGEWYRRLADGAGAGPKAAMLARARAYYDRFLSIHPSADLDRTKASLALKKVEEDIKQVSGPPLKSGARQVWADVLALVDPARDASAGKWVRKGPAIVGPVGATHAEAKIVIPVAPQGNYELEAKFVRLSGTDTVGFILPVGARGVTLLMSAWRGRATGLGDVNGKQAGSNETSVKPHTLENGHEYQLNVKIAVTASQAHVTVTLDGKPLIDWKGPESALSHQGGWGPPRPGFLAVGFSNSTGVFNSIRLKMLSGEAKVVRPDGAVVPLPK